MMTFNSPISDLESMLPELNGNQLKWLERYIASREQAARLDELELAVQQFIFNTSSNENNFSEYATHRIKELTNPEGEEHDD